MKAAEAITRISSIIGPLFQDESISGVRESSQLRMLRPLLSPSYVTVVMPFVVHDYFLP